MKIIFITIPIAFLLGISYAEEAHHNHNSHTAAKKSTHSRSALVLNNGKKWPVDQNMKENMDAIYQQFKNINELAKTKKLTNEDALNLNTVIFASTKNIIAKCKMERKQDEAFHVLLADLFAVTADIELESALKKLASTLETYSKYFDHSK